MRTVELHDGKALKIDLYKITIKEWRSIFSPDQEQAEEDKIIARVLGLKVDELLALPQPDYKKAVTAVLEAARAPEDEKNLPSASTED